MLTQEERARPEGGVLGLNGYFWEQRQFICVGPVWIDPFSQPYYYFPLCGQLSLQELPVVSGSLLSEEMGLGKTVEVISLLLASPASAEVLRQERLTIQRLEDAEEAKRLAREEKEAARAVARKRKRDAEDEAVHDGGGGGGDAAASAGGTGQQVAVPPPPIVPYSRAQRAASRRAAQEKADAAAQALRGVSVDAEEDEDMHHVVVAAAMESSDATSSSCNKKPPISKAAMKTYIPQCKATLIIVPISLLLQWTRELANKAPSLAVLVLHGDKKHSVKVIIITLTCCIDYGVSFLINFVIDC
jgi:hypothetical protein